MFSGELRLREVLRVASNSELYELTDTSVYMGQICKNVYFFQSSPTLGSGFDASDLVDAFLSDLLPTILFPQPNDLIHTNVTARSLFDESNRDDRAVSEPGERSAAEALPVYEAFGLRLTQDNGAIKNGGKRYAGVQEGDQNDGVITNATTLGWLDDLADALAQVLTVGISNIFFPVVVGRILDGDDYRLPADLGESVVGNIIDAVLNILLTSQVSRKIGVGE